MRRIINKCLWVILSLGLAVSAVNAEMIAGYKFDGDTLNVTGNTYFDMQLGSTAVYDPDTPLGGVGNQALDASLGQYEGAFFGYDLPQPNFGLTNNGAFTLMAWFKTEQTSGVGQIFSRRQASTGNGWSLAYMNEQAFLFVQGSTVNAGRIAIGGSNLNDGQWHHLVGVSDPNSDLDGNGDGELFLYIDGELAGGDIKTQPETIEYGTANVFIGGGFDGGGVYNKLWGFVDEPAVFDHALSADDAAYYYLNSIEAPSGELLVGDANRDGQVSAGDYASVQANFGNTGAPNDPNLFGDANLDGLVSAGDYASVQANFGNVAGVGVPEPMTMSILALGMVALIKRRK